ncbi:hypothetical protein DRE_07240 [Drechslerella stenobrocha 248]|uniref:COX assembly mitochondrial protein n=1 Tax=Drechslerella stenobrocha 248 TaxID=1043628 RepID=W7HVD0_9PEZI|nr:hypothetical protein DRE_07240 [Drechslerella stenobrocha 248]
MPRPVVNPTGSVPDPSQPRYSLPSTNPLPLSAGQEHQVREQYYANVRAICAEEIRRYADCARGRTFSMVWRCREQQHAMNACMIANATPEEQDRAREEWFRKRLEKAERARRRKEREEAQAAGSTEKKEGG